MLYHQQDFSTHFADYGIHLNRHQFRMLLHKIQIIGIFSADPVFRINFVPALLFRARLPDVHPGHAPARQVKNIPGQIVVKGFLAFLKNIRMGRHHVMKCLTLTQAVPDQRHILLNLGF